MKKDSRPLARYRELLTETGDSVAAAVLALAETIDESGNKAPGDLLTIDQAADRLAVSVSTVRNLVASGKLGGVRVGVGRGAIRIRPADIDAYNRDAQPAGKVEAAGVTIETLEAMVAGERRRRRREK